VDVQTPDIETGEQVADRIRAQKWLASEQTLITSSCGFNHLPRHIVMGKLLAMTEARSILKGKARQ
jgi:5-methyltetrahydropteroyltriglutamate--homocysteine methyltransferase